MNTVKVGTGVLVWRDGKVLFDQRLGAHGANTWSVPGGHLEYGERWEDCATREVLEETVMHITNIRHLATCNDIFAENKHYVTIWMKANWLRHEPRITEPDKYIDQRWFSLHELPTPLFEPCWTNLRAVKPELFLLKAG